MAISSARKVATAAGVLTVLVGLVLHVTRLDGRWHQAVYLAFVCGAAPLAWVGALRGGRPRAGRVLLAAGITLSALGELTYAMFEWLWNEFPDASIADAGWLLSYVAIGAALIVLLRQSPSSHRRDIDGIIDTAVMGVVSGLVVWQFWVEPMLNDASVSIGVRVIWAAYPILDAALVALVGRALTSRSFHRVGSGFLAGGVLCWLGSDLGFLILGEETSASVWLDAGWMLGAALLAAAVWRTALPGNEPAKPVSNEVQTVSALRFVLGLAPLAIPGALELIAFRAGNDTNPIPLLIGSVLLIGLAALRGSRVIATARRANQRMASSERRYRALSANSSDAVVLVDEVGRILGTSQEIMVAGHRLDLAAGTDMSALVASDDADSFRSVLERSSAVPGEVVDGEFRLAGPSGSNVWIGARFVDLSADADVAAIVVNLHDVTVRRQAVNELTHHAFHDALTGLANRALFSDRIDHALNLRRRTGADPSVLFIDLDGFKRVNDSLGHDAGDELLREVARRLLAVVRSGDTVARLGGDEFAVLIEETRTTVDEVTALGERIVAAVQKPVVINGRTVSPSASVGIAAGDADSTPTSLLRDADIAMYSAKAGGRGKHVRFVPAMRAAAIERIQIEGDLNRALAENHFTVAYQPVMDLDVDRVIGFEALIRWNHPTLGNVAPDRFIPIAEDNGMIIPIGLWVLRTACSAAARWQQERPDQKHLTIAVNLSARQLASPSLLADVRRALSDSCLAPASLVLEMTETALVSDPEIATRRLAELRTLGVRLAIDDFGTGYSSLSYLRQFPVDILKIDRSFVNTIQPGSELPPLVRGLLDLGHTLDLEIVAEGIETASQLEQLRQQHCGYGQGYLFAKAIPCHEVSEYLARESARKSGAVAAASG